MKTRIFKLIILLTILIINPVSAQQGLITVNGKVVDEEQNPITGAKVIEKGKKTATTTDINGKFTLSVNIGAILKVSYIGYETKEVKASSSALIIKLKAYTQVMDEVFVIGYGTSRSYDLTGGISYNKSVQASNYNYTQVNTEEYKSYAENRFKDAKNDPLSTFSLDVDAASYSNVRRMINNGQLPDKNSVRVEEMINYFSYNYAQPTGKDPVKINTETHACPWNPSHLLVRIGVKAKEIPSENLPASNFVFLLDVSGSMDAQNKLPLVQSSIKLLTNNLRPKDRVAIVVYAGAAGVALESTTGDDKQKIITAVENLQAGGSTAGGEGIELAYKIAQRNFIEGGNNRIILCTDGDFNVGVSSEQGLEQLIESKRKTGIYLTVLGYGMGNYKDNKLQVLAEKGNGNHAYIDNIQEANKFLVNEFGSTMYAVAKDVKLQVEFNPAYVSSYRLVGYESRLLNKEDFNDDTKDAGELGAGHTVTAFYEVIPVGVDNRYGGVDDLRYKEKETTGTTKNSDNNELMYVKLRYKPINSDVSIKMEVPVINTINIIKEQIPSEDYMFAASVAMFAQLLKDSDFKGTATYNQVIDLANKSVGVDKNGYRREFVRLVEAVNQLKK